jgi:hypothetical protein
MPWMLNFQPRALPLGAVRDTKNKFPDESLKIKTKPREWSESKDETKLPGLPDQT